MPPRKPKHLFISHSSKDAAVAMAICGVLQRAGFTTWIAPRDLRAGKWQGGLREAITQAGAVVLLWSHNSDRSDQVARELAWADEAKVDILPLQLEVVQGGELEYNLKLLQWFPAIGPTGRLLARTIVSAASDVLAGRGRADVEPYMVTRGAMPFKQYTDGPQQSVDLTLAGEETTRSLRNKLLRGRHKLQRPVKITVAGTLFPCALLSSGWWDKHTETRNRNIKWRDDVQQWLFHGFDEWGPSWDFTWDLEKKAKAKRHPYFIAQLGDGDEANSIPVLLTASKARKLRDEFQERPGGMEAKVTGVLGHRKHFAKLVDADALELFGGLLDYCLYLDEDKKDHKVEQRADDTAIYSGYLWKCVAPQAFLKEGTPRLNDVYFIWEHVNFASDEARKYGIEALEAKEEMIRRRHGKLVLMQKSSPLVAGTPTLSADAVYKMLLGKTGKEF